ncbi:MAG: DJ-1 family glyoxalase III [Candidatus Kapaibacteriales bacterium]
MEVLVIISNGTEELEAVSAIDIFRRAKFEVTVAGTETPIICSRGTKIIPDIIIENINKQKLYDLIFLPGGTEGTKNLNANPKVEFMIHNHMLNNKYIAAICAAPIILLEKGIINKNLSVTSHPSVAYRFSDYNYSESPFVFDNKILTSRGAGTSISFALGIVELLAGKELAEKIAQEIVFK